MTASPRKSNLLMKVVIVVLVFPILFQVFRLVALPMMMFSEHLGTESEHGKAIRLFVVAVSFLSGLGGSFWICWKIWPKTPRD